MSLVLTYGTTFSHAFKSYKESIAATLRKPVRNFIKSTFEIFWKSKVKTLNSRHLDHRQRYITLKMAHPHQNLEGDWQPSYQPADNSPFTLNAILSGADEVPPSYQRPDDVALCYFDHSIASPMFLQPYEDIDFSIGLDECHGTDAQQSAEPWSETGWPLTDMDAATYMNFQPESLFELNHQSEW